MKASLTGVVVAATLALTACSGAAPPSGTGPAPDAFHPRPRTIDVHSLDPCRALRPEQADDWGVDVTQRDDAGPSLPGCAYLRAGRETYVVQFLTHTPAEKLLPGAPQQEGTKGLRDPVATTLDGFGAVEARLTRGSPVDCAITVDTGPASSIQFVYSSLDTRSSPELLQAGCDKARRFAHLGLQNLSSAG